MDALAKDGAPPRYEAEVVEIRDIDGSRPTVVYVGGRGRSARLLANSSPAATAFTAPSRKSVEAKLKTYERVYPFGWLGVLSRDAAGLATS